MPKFLDLIARPAAGAALAGRAISFRVRMVLLHRRYSAFRWFAEAAPKAVPKPRVLIVFTHIVSEAVARGDSGSAVDAKTERLVAAIDGVLTSFAHCALTIVLNTMAGRNIHHRLPDYQQSRVEIVEYNDGDPLLAGFRVQDICADRIDAHDWFAFLEDDVVISDSTFLDKLAHFNAATPDSSAILMPNRFEMYRGRKYYIDLVQGPDKETWNATTQFEAGGIRFAEFANTHSALYFLNHSQMSGWLKSPRAGYNKVTFVGPLESAVTGSLMEYFHIYRPHYVNARYLEVRHWDLKYSVMQEENPGTLKEMY